MTRMTPRTLPTLRAMLAVTISIGALGFLAMPVHADKRTSAPIVYAGQGNTASSTARTRSRRAPTPRRSTRQTRTPASAPPVANTATPGKRVEFRYPDQPDRFYGVGGTRPAVDAPPLSFSSSETAISETAARQYANSSPAPLPQLAATVPSDPAITPGGFDARAAAARHAQHSAPKPAPVRAAPIADPARQNEPTAPYISAAGIADFSAAEISKVQAATNEVPVSGVEQTPKADAVYDQTGRASVFETDLDGQPTANGEVLDLNAMIAAHPTLPLPSLVQVISLENNREIVVRVNDRGPFDGGGLIELSTRAAEIIGIDAGQSANVRVRYLGPAPVAASAVEQPARTTPHISPSPTPVPPALPKSTPELAGGPSATITHKASIYTAPQSSASDASYYVQLGSFSNIANAQNLHAQIASATNVEIVPVRVNGADFFRVMAGPVANSHDADILRAYLANQGIADGIIVNQG